MGGLISEIKVEIEKTPVVDLVCVHVYKCTLMHTQTHVYLNTYEHTDTKELAELDE